MRFWSKEQSDVARNRAMGGQRGYKRSSHTIVICIETLYMIQQDQQYYVPKRWSVICIGTLLMVPEAGARDRMVQSVVINFSSKVYSKSLLKGSPLSCTSL